MPVCAQPMFVSGVRENNPQICSRNKPEMANLVVGAVRAEKIASEKPLERLASRKRNSLKSEMATSRVNIVAPSSHSQNSVKQSAVLAAFMLTVNLVSRNDTITGIEVGNKPVVGAQKIANATSSNTDSGCLSTNPRRRRPLTELLQAQSSRNCMRPRTAITAKSRLARSSGQLTTKSRYLGMVDTLPVTSSWHVVAATHLSPTGPTKNFWRS